MNIFYYPGVKKMYANYGISWKYIVLDVYSCVIWWGGCYERMIRFVKTSLRKVIRRSLLLSELETLLIELEAIINSCTLTYTYSELEEPSSLIF